jgi:hypothetical protein
MTMIAISDVQVADRHRSDLGDLAGLADSLREVGQLQPIIVTSDLRLVAGGRRLAAAQSLGWTEIEAKVARNLTDAVMLLRAELDENTCRKPFTPTEEHSLYEALLTLENSLGASPGISEGTRADDGHVRPAASERTRRSVADIVTGSAGRHKTLEKVGEVKHIAEDASRSEQLRRTAREALAEMDRTGNVAGPHMRVRLAERAETARGRTDTSTWSEEEQSLLKLLRDGQTVVVSLREHHENLVRWAEANGLLIPVDRRTEWGNPFEMPYDGDRETVIRNYAESYLPHKPSLLSRISELKGKALACWCAPERCHADVLKTKAEGINP